MVSQYQLEEVIAWAIHLKYIQAVLKEFDNIATPKEDFLIWYFQIGLRPFIYTQLNKQNRGLDSWQEIIKKVINAKAKIDY